MKNQKVVKMVFSALFVALGIIMPFLTMQIPQFGSMLLPMHLPVLVCGFVCGWNYGLLVGFVTPLLRSMMFGMPPIMPTAAAMAFELAVYGAVTGFLYDRLPKKTISIYVALILAMLSGRIVWGIVSIPIYVAAGSAFSWKIFFAGAFINAIPGMILQLILVPGIVISLRHARVLNPENSKYIAA